MASIIIGRESLAGTFEVLPAASVMIDTNKSANFSDAFTELISGISSAKTLQRFSTTAPGKLSM